MFQRHVWCKGGTRGTSKVAHVVCLCFIKEKKNSRDLIHYSSALLGWNPKEKDEDKAREKDADAGD